ncbi:MAG: DUF222 domain-containing protein [Acidimicrobiales bacterium]
MVGVLVRPEPVERLGVDWVVGLVRSALEDDASAASDDELCGEVRAIEAMRSVLDAAEARRLAELDRRDVTMRHHGLATDRWLARAAGLSRRTARARAATAAKLAKGFGGLIDAVDEGRISFDHAKAVADVANPRNHDGLVQLQHDLVDAADHTVFERWRHELSGIAELLDDDGGHDPTGDDPRTGLTVSPILDNAVDLAGTLVGLDAAEVAATIDAVADELARQARADHNRSPELAVPSRRVLRAKALVEICRRARAHRRSVSAPARPEVVLVTAASDPLAEVTTTDGAPLADATMRRLICDADWYTVVVDSLGTPLDHGRLQRFATAAQRRALLTRDGGCVFPGCDAPWPWIQAHHLDDFDHGGRTDLVRLAAVCTSAHHNLAHTPGWHLHATDDGWCWWTTPTGQSFWGQRHGRQRTGPTPEHPHWDPDAPVPTIDLRTGAATLVNHGPLELRAPRHDPPLACHDGIAVTLQRIEPPRLLTQNARVLPTRSTSQLPRRRSDRRGCGPVAASFAKERRWRPYSPSRSPPSRQRRPADLPTCRPDRPAWRSSSSVHPGNEAPCADQQLDPHGTGV